MPDSPPPTKPKPYSTQSVVPRAAWRDRLYVVIFEADTAAGKWFDLALLGAILLSIVVINLETVEYFENSQAWLNLFLVVEWALTVLFTVEYVSRIVSSHRPWRYVFSFFGIIDLLACLPLWLTLLSFDSHALTIVRSVRLLRVFRVMKMMRMLREAESLKQAVWNARDKVFVFLATVLVAVTISGTLMYQVEHGTEGNLSQFTSIPQSMYWAIVTMTTVGYGDVVPHTPTGKFISAALILLGYSLIIVPTGFISAEFHAQKTAAYHNTRTCPHCFREGHAAEANFCSHCGAALIEA
ncbi:MAG: ion transporter [Planctomycetales bacterium]|nr:ion transporter [Planctomycetales bacterium]